MPPATQFTQEKAMGTMLKIREVHEAFAVARFDETGDQNAMAAHFDRGIEALERLANSLGLKLMQIEGTEL